jgi:hypothetical protein
MIKNGKKIGSFIVALFFAIIMTSNVFAASSVNTPTKKYINNYAIAADDAITMSNIIITESVISSFGSTNGGKFTIKIPADLTLYPSLDALNVGGSSSGTTSATTNALTKSTGVFGSSSLPHNVYFSASGFTGTLWIYETSNSATTLAEAGSAIGLLKVYKKGSSAVSITSAFQYGSGQGYGSARAMVSLFSDPSSVMTSSAYNATSASSLNRVGQIYYNTTTQEIVLTLAAKGQSASFLEKIVLEGLKLFPANTTGSGDQDFTLADGNAAGTADLLGVSGATLTMANLTTAPLIASGASSGAANVPPTIAGGSTVIDGQAMGQLKLTLVGATTGNNNVLTVSLDNGAKFHSSADGTGANQLGTLLTVGSDSWTTFEANHTNSSLVVNTAGKLVINLGSGAATANQAVIKFARNTTGTIIDTSGLTTAGDITATVTGTGPNFDGFSGTAVVADGQLKGTTISFKESSGATELSTLYTGRTGETTSDGLTLAELAPGTLFAGGSIVFTLDQGAKFTTGDSITSTQAAAVSGVYTTSNLSLPNVSIGAASATATSLVTTVSDTNQGKYHYTSFSFNLASATAGPLGITVSGTAGASGAITIATIMDATASTVASTVDVIPGNIVNIPDITITEQKAGALAVGKIGLKFPTGYTLDVSNATVTATITGGTASSNVTIGSVDTGDENYMYISVGAVSQTSTGPYTIVISGIEATTTSAVVSANVKIGGASSGDWTSDASTFNSNTGAKPKAQTVSFGSIVSATVPYFGTAVVNGTIVSQTFIPAGNDIGLVGDVYVFTSGQYHDGTTWTATETPYLSGAVLGSTTVVYDTAGLAGGSKVYLGYGKGLTGTYSTMNTNATFVLSYTTAATVPVAVGAGAGDAVTATINTSDTYDVTLTTTNAAGATPTQEWIAYQVIVSGSASGWWFMTPTGSVQYTAGMDLTTVQYPTAAAGSINVGQFKLGDYLPTAGDQLILAYVYSVSGIDIADPTSYVVENVVTMTVQ